MISTKDKYVAATQFQVEQKFWKEVLQQDFNVSNFKGKISSSQIKHSSTYEKLEITLDASLSQKLLTLCNNSDYLVHVFFLAQTALLLSKFIFNNDIIIGTAIYKQKSYENLINKVLPVCVKIHENLTFKQLLVQTKKFLDHAVENQNYPIELLLNDKQNSNIPIFDIAVIVNSLHDLEALKGQKLSTLFKINTLQNNIHITLEYDRNIYELSFAEKIKQNLLNLIEITLKNFDVEFKHIDFIIQQERNEILKNYNATAKDYKNDNNLGNIINKQAIEKPDLIAVQFSDQFLTFKELNNKAEKIASFLLEGFGLSTGDCVGIMLERSIELIVAFWGVIKAGLVYLPLDVNQPEKRIASIINDANMEVLISGKRFVKKANRLLWGCKSLRLFFGIDSYNILNESEEDTNELMNNNLWEYVGETGNDRITKGGWFSSFTGLPFTSAEMDEYSENIYIKIKKLLSLNTRVLEIGCASGLTMFKLANEVNYYLGTDMSASIINFNKAQVEEKGYKNIGLQCIFAHNINQLADDNFDIIILNSIIHCFHGYNYLIDVLKKCIGLISKSGHIFIGDILDFELKNQLEKDTLDFKSDSKNQNFNTKTDWSNELFVPITFWENIREELTFVDDIEFSPKIFTIENELTKYRYDVVLSINKPKVNKNYPPKTKFQVDLCTLDRYKSGIVLPEVSSNSSAYVIYTSGSTGMPKGVITEHRSIINRINWMQDMYHLDNKDIIMHKTPISFDVSLWELLWWAFTGSKLYLLDPVAEKHPKIICNAISKYNVSIIHFVPSMLDLFLDYQLETEEKACLKNIRVVISSGEALQKKHLEKFNKLTQGNKSYIANLYGPTEASVDVSYYNCPKQNTPDLIPIGKPIGNMGLHILDEYQKKVPIGAIGELYISGIGLAKGYLNNPELSAERFLPFHGNGQIYKTGDLARWLDDGNIEFLGRKDNQVKIKGIRIELNEIENTIRKFPKVKDCTVVIHEFENHDKYICAYYVKQGEISEEELIIFLHSKLPAYMVPQFLTSVDLIPTTLNGKTNKKLLPKPHLNTSGANAEPKTKTEEILSKIWKETIGLSNVSVDDNFFSLGGDSIKAIRVLTSINKIFSLEMSITELFKNNTIVDFARAIDKRREKDRSKDVKKILDLFKDIKDTAIQKINHPNNVADIFPASDVQKGILFYYLKNYRTNMYHDQILYPFSSLSFDIKSFNEAVDKLVEKHDMLRTIFSNDENGEFLQIVLKDFNYDIKYYDSLPVDYDEQNKFLNKILENDRKEPFNHTLPPLWRIKIFKKDSQNFVLALIYHHAILDGWSNIVLLNDLMDIYKRIRNSQRITLTPLECSYKNVVVHEFLNKNNNETIEFWKNELKHSHKLVLPQPFKINENQNTNMKKFYFEVSGDLFDKVNSFAKRNNVSQKNVYFSAYVYVLSLITNERQIVSGYVTHNRPSLKDGDNLLGCFLNTLPVKISIDRENSWEDYVKAIDDKLNQIQSHSVLSLAEIRKITDSNNYDDNPFFDTLFNYIDFFHLPDFDISKPRQAGNLQNDNLIATTDTNTFFDFEMSVTKGRINLMPKYNILKFDGSLIEQICNYFEAVLFNIVDYSKKNINESKIISKDEECKILTEHSCKEIEKQVKHTLKDIVENQFNGNKDSIAICHNNQMVTYGKLDENSKGLGNELYLSGIKNNGLVAVLCERGITMITSILGIIRSGGAYVPIDSKQPIRRIKNILNHSKLEFIIVDYENLPKIKEIVKNNDCTIKKIIVAGKFLRKNEILNIGATEIIFFNELKEYSKIEINTKISTEHYAYAIFTSGSTGIPKGVLIQHEKAVNLIHWVNSKYQVSNLDKLLFVTSVGFDLSVYDIFGVLAAGGMIRIADDETVKNPVALFKIIEKENITFWNSAPAVIQQLFMLPDSFYKHFRKNSLRLLFLSGDWVPVKLAQQIKTNFKNARLVVLGGATEATIWSNYFEPDNVDTSWKSIPYGIPITNAFYYVLNDDLQVCPIGVPGDLYIGGSCLATGYLNDPVQSNQNFILNPYFEYIISLEKKKTIPVSKSHSFKYLYKTGDIVRWMHDGNLEFLGRKEHHLKVRGARVDIAEIEKVIALQKNIDNVVVSIYNQGKKNVLCAYYTANISIDGEKLRKMSSQYLPDYMIPQFFIQITQVPITINGKVDKKQLPPPDGLTTERKVVGPSNKNEQLLIKLWSDILEKKVQEISVDDNFFEIGGDSLLTTKLVALIYRETNIQISITDIYENPIIRDLALLLNTFSSGNGVVAADSNIVLIRKGKEKNKNVFLVHAGSGEVNVYNKLCSLLNDDYNYWGIKSNIYSDFLPRDLTIESLAEKYYSIIKKVQDKGPYNIIGWCIGGVIGFQLSKLLREDQQVVERLIIINSFSPDEQFNEKIEKFDLNNELKLFRAIVPSEVNLSITGAGIQELWQKVFIYLSENLDAFEKLKNILQKDSVFNAIPQNARNNVQDFLYYFNLIRSIMKASMQYTETAIDIDINYIEASDSNVFNRDKWKEYTLKKFSKYIVNGDNFSILENPDVYFLAEIIKEII